MSEDENQEQRQAFQQQAYLAIGEQMRQAMKRAAYDGIVGLGDPEDCSIARFYHAGREYPVLKIEGEDDLGEAAQVELDAQELIALYDALTMRIAYLRECAKREAGE